MNIHAALYDETKAKGWPAIHIKKDWKHTCSKSFLHEDALGHVRGWARRTCWNRLPESIGAGSVWLSPGAYIFNRSVDRYCAAREAYQYKTSHGPPERVRVGHF